MNDRLEDTLNGSAGQIALLDQVMKLSARDLIFLAVPLLVLLWFWPLGEEERALNQRVAASVVMATIIALLLNSLVGRLHQEARPFVSDVSTRLLIPHSTDNSFPSEHATFAFAVAAAMLRWRRLLGTIALAGAFIVGISRVYVGVHWPSDIAVSAAIGTLVGASLAAAMPLLVRAQLVLSRFLPRPLIARPADYH